MAVGNENQRLLTTEEVAAHYRVSGRTIERWRKEGMPCTQPNGRKGRLLYDLEAVQQWVANRETERVREAV